MRSLKECLEQLYEAPMNQRKLMEAITMMMHVYLVQEQYFDGAFGRIQPQLTLDELIIFADIFAKQLPSHGLSPEQIGLALTFNEMARNQITEIAALVR